MYETLDAGYNTNNNSTNINLEKIEQLVNNINARFAALQRQANQSSQNTSAHLREFTLEPSLLESKTPIISPSGRVGSTSVPVLLPDSNLHSPTLIPAILPCSKQHGPHYWSERELFVAASDLCQFINGGINYRVMCLQYQRMMELLLSLVREDVALMRDMDIFPGGSMEKIHKVFSGLFAEAKQLLAEGGLEIPDSQNTEEESFFSPTTDVKDINNNSNNNNNNNETDNTNSEYHTHIVQVQRQSNSGTLIRHAKGNDKRTSSGSNIYATGVSSKPNIRVTINTGNDKSDTREEPFAPLHFATSTGRSINEDFCDVASPESTLKEDGTIKSHRFSTPKSEIDLFTKSINSNSRSRNQCLEDLYGDMYRNEGMDMISAIMRVVFLKEYDQGDSTTGKNAFVEFKKQIEDQILPSIKSYDIFMQKVTEKPEIRCEYVVNCLHSHIKPNDRVVEILNGITSERETTSLTLMNTQIGDSGIKPLAPLLARFHRLKFIDLSYNDIHDTGIHELCLGLQHHPTLEVIDLSGNPITDTSGAALLQLASVVPQLKAVGQHGIYFSPHVREALGRQLQHNRDASGKAWAPPQILNNNINTNININPTTRLELWKRGASPRLTPMPPNVIPNTTTTTTTTTITPTTEGGPVVSLRKELTVRNTQESVVPRGLGVLQRVRLPYLTASRGSAGNGDLHLHRQSQSTPR